VRRALRLASPLLLLPLAGCLASVQNYLHPRVDMIDTKPQPVVAAAPPPPVATGSIFNSATYRPLFEDHRARLVGDTLTVQIVEKVSASAKSTSTVDKNGSVEAGITALPLVKSLTARQRLGHRQQHLRRQGRHREQQRLHRHHHRGGARGAAQRPPAGGRREADRRQQQRRQLRFSGQLDPRTIQAGNTVPSTQIANVRLEQRGRGAQADAQVMGWLGRVFLSVLPI
jgi:flagellar L-ring protein precursor FlgH